MSSSLLHDGTYVDFQSKEINVAVHFFSEHGSRATDIADYIRTNVSARREAAPVQGFSFLPAGLGKIRDFQVRVHVAAFSGSDATPLAQAAFGGSAIVIVTANDPVAYRTTVERVLTSPGYFDKTPIILFVEDEDPSRVAPEHPPSVALVIPTKPATQADYFTPLKAALKLALEKLKEPNNAMDAGSLVPVAVVPLVDLLRAEEKRKGRPLTQQEVIDIRDHATFIALTPAKAAAVEQSRGRDVDSASCWQDWQARRTE